MSEQSAAEIGAQLAQSVGATKPRAIDRVRAAFTMKPWRLSVEEWPNEDGTPMVVTFLPLTMKDLEIIREGKDSDSSKLAEQVRLLIHKARDENGKPLFLAGDFHFLMSEARATVIQKIVNFMYTCGALSVDEAREAVGNSSGFATPSSSPPTST